MPRRGSEWIDTLVDFEVADVSETTLGLGTPSAGGSTEGYTAVRMIVDLSVYPAVTPSNDGYQSLDFGIGVATFDAISAGALPDLRTVSDRPIGDWMIRGQRMVIQGNTEVVQATHIFHDIRAQRKLAGGNMFLAVASNSRLGVAFACDVRGMIRVLVLRP